MKGSSLSRHTIDEEAVVAADMVELVHGSTELLKGLVAIHGERLANRLAIDFNRQLDKLTALH